MARSTGRRRAARCVGGRLCAAVAVLTMTDVSTYPLVFRVRQKFDAPQVTDVAGEVEAQLARLQLNKKITSGQTVAIAVGSRGIANIRHIVKAAADHVRALGASPFIVPAMGSHGGGKAERQRQIVESLGVTEDVCGCPIRSSMETVVVCEAAEGFAVHFDKHAYQADHVVVCNRIKTHTQFIGDVESGLMKMLLIGLGKHAGAEIYHRAIKDYSFGQIVRSVAGQVLSKCRIAAGLGIVENGYCKTALIEAIAPDQFEQREKPLLQKAKQWAARLPFDAADILLIDEIGKHISGTGFDLSITGRRKYDHRAADDEYPKIRMIALRDLAAASDGNAEGIGLAEFCLKRLIEKVDMHATHINSLTSGHVTASMIPTDFDTDHRMLAAMLSQIGLTEPPDAKLMWIRNTASLAEVECSAAYLQQAQHRDDLEILSESRPLPFGEIGNLCDDHMNQGE